MPNVPIIKVEETASLTESDFTHTTSSTVWGPGALSGKALKAIGEISLDMIMKVIIHRRLAAIKRRFDNHPSVFVKPEVSEEVRQIERDLRELRKLSIQYICNCSLTNIYNPREGYSRRIRQSAISLFIDMRTIRQQFGRIRDAWNTNRYLFTEPQSLEEKKQREAMFSALQQMCK